MPRVARFALGRPDEGRARRERAEDVPDREVEGQGGQTQDDVVDTDVLEPVDVEQRVGCCRVRDRDDLEEAHRLTLSLGGCQLQAARRPEDNPDVDEMFTVYASPAGHPFCFGVH